MKPEMMHHVAINVADYEAVKAFYTEKLGFRILGEYVFPSGTRRMDCCLGSIRLEIFQSDRITERPDGQVLGYRHLCFRVADIHKTVAWLESLGVETEPVRPDPMTGERMTFFRDPEGLVLELHE